MRRKPISNNLDCNDNYLYNLDYNDNYLYNLDYNYYNYSYKSMYLFTDYVMISVFFELQIIVRFKNIVQILYIDVFRKRMFLRMVSMLALITNSMNQFEIN